MPDRNVFFREGEKREGREGGDREHERHIEADWNLILIHWELAILDKLFLASVFLTGKCV